jgi:hypothetical protein
LQRHDWWAEEAVSAARLTLPQELQDLIMEMTGERQISLEEAKRNKQEADTERARLDQRLEDNPPTIDFEPEY